MRRFFVPENGRSRPFPSLTLTLHNFSAQDRRPASLAASSESCSIFPILTQAELCSGWKNLCAPLNIPL